MSEWDTCKTDELLKAYENLSSNRSEKSKQRKLADQNEKENFVTQLEQDLKIAQKLATKAYQELEKRITEHDTAVQDGFERTDITESVIHQHEMVKK